MAVTKQATIGDLYRSRRPAELVRGELRIRDGTGHLPNRAAAAVYRSLYEQERRTRSGLAYTDNAVFVVDLPHRKSFSPDAAFYTGQPQGMKFLTGAPALAVEVRSMNDYGRAAETERAEKRRDYFAAGTSVVWDVDLLGPDTIRVFRDGDSQRPAAVYRRGETAEAEPALPGWRFPVDELFD